MLNIQKRHEPRSLTRHRCNPNSDYQNIPERARKDLQRQLLLEQGYLCAYCMERISADNMKVEHVFSKSRHPELQLTYANLVACCTGNEGCPHEEQHCDTYKGNKDLSKNPAASGSRIEENITYDREGAIHSTEVDFDRELNCVLNLNIAKLCNNRKSVMNAVIKCLRKLPQNAGKSELQKILDNWSRRDKDRKLQPYAGVAIYFLKMRLRKC